MVVQHDDSYLENRATYNRLIGEKIITLDFYFKLKNIYLLLQVPL